MGIMFMFLIAFGISWAVIYGAMRLVCFIKRKYCQAENLLCKVFEQFECVSCREACMDHRRLFIRSVLFAVVIAGVFVVAHCVR